MDELALSLQAGTSCHDPKQFRHYGPMAQDFFASFGHGGLGQIGSETTINSGDITGILMIAVQAPGEAHGGAKTEKGADCGASSTAAGAGVATEPAYPDHSREAVGICVNMTFPCLRVNRNEKSVF